MTKLRVIYDNAADRATLSTSATAGTLGSSNLTSDIKSRVCRSTGTTLTITATWANAETIAGVVLAHTNVTTGCTIRVQGYTNSADSTAAFDTGNVTGCPAVSPVKAAMQSTGVNSFAYGGGNYVRAWFNPLAVKKIVITLTDTGNAQGYVEASRLICGNYWAPIVGADVQGTTMTLVDKTTQYRTASGDMMVWAGPKYRKQAINLPSLDKTDRAKMWNILWGNGMCVPLFISLFPNDDDPLREQTHMIYGRLTATPVMSTPYFSYMSATIDIEEV